MTLTPEEIDRMAAAGDILVRTMSLLAGKIRPGVTTGELDQAAERFIRSQGSRGSFLAGGAAQPNKVSSRRVRAETRIVVCMGTLVSARGTKRAL